MSRLVLTALLAACGLVSADVTSPLPRAHAHNDYLHKRPLLDALAQGFCSVEADIFLVNGELQVGHSKNQLRKGRTLESLYLSPLAERVRANQGSVYPQKERFILLVDIKSDGNEIYPVLDALLERYRDMLSGVAGQIHTERGVRVILSGNRPRALVAADPTRYCAIDGRPSDFGSTESPTAVPLISDNWRNHFKWRGRGEFPVAEAARLQEFVTRAHKEKRLIRFWGAPDNEQAWAILLKAGVDLVNTDHLQELAEFMKRQPEK
mgnify:CR=1 FL=1